MISVLYVDDEQALLEIARLFLEETGGFRVGTAVSATDALETGAIGSYDAIISDFQMPGMDGIAFLKQVRQRYGDIPFILFTGRGREEVVIEAINNGADFYLQKGGDPEAQFAELAHKIRQSVRRKRAERSLQDSERRLTDIIDFLPDATFAIDREGRVIAWNRAIEELTGVPAGEMLGKADHEYSVPFYGERRPILIDLVSFPEEEIERKYSHIVRSGPMLTADTTLPHLQGKQRALWGKASLLYDQEGNVTGAIESIRDITDRKILESDLERKHTELKASYEQITAAEEELREQYDELAGSEQKIRESESRYRSIIENSPLGMHFYELKADGSLVFAGANPSADRILGVDHSRFTGQEIGTAFPALAGTEIPDRYRAIAETGGIWQKEQVVYEGEAIHGAYAVIAFRTAPRSMVAVFEDITEKKQQEDRLAFDNALLSAQQETSLDAILIVDENGKIINYNRQFIALWGVPEDLVAQGVDEPVLRFVTEQLADPPAFLSRVRYLYEHREEKSFEEIALRDGRVLERFSSPMMGENGRYYGRVWYFRDITRRKRAEQDLQRSEERLRQFIQQAPAALAMFDREMHYLAASRWWMADYHLGDRDIAGRSHYEIFPEISEDLKAIHRRALSGEVVSAEEDRFVRSDGSVQWLSWEVRPWYTTDNRIGGIIIYSADITTRKKAEEALRESEAKYRTLVETANEGIWVVDADFITVFTNKKLQELFGCTGPEMLGRYVRDFAVPDEREEIGKILAERQAGNPGRYERRWMRKDGTVVWCLTSASPLFSPEGKFLGSFGMFTDITERKKAESVLKESEEKYRSLVENANEAITIIQDWCMVYANPRMAELVGIPAGDLTGKPFLDTVWPEDREMLRTRHAKRVTGQDVPKKYDFRMIGPGGNPHWINISIAKIKWQGRPATLNIMTDITEQKLAEAALRDSEVKFRNLIQNSSDMIRIIGRDGLIAYSSPSTLRLFGYDPAGLIGKDPLDYVHPDDRQRAKDALREVFGGTNAGVPTEYRIRHKDGHYIDVESVGSNQLDTPGINGIVTTTRPITERKRGEASLEESERRFETVFRDSPVALTLLSAADGRFADVNEAFVRGSGFSRGDVIGRTPQEAGIFADPTGPERLAAAMKDGRTVQGLEIRCRRKSGGIRICRFSSGIITMDGKPFILSSIEDVTDQKAAGEALLRSEEKYRLLTENSADIIYAMDLEGNITHVSSQVSRYGFAPDQVIGHNIAEFIADDDIPRIREDIRITIATGQSTHTIFRLRDSPNNPVWLEDNGSAIRNADGSATGITGVLRDITGRVRAEAALEKSEGWLYRLAEHAPDMIFRMSLPDGNYEYISPAVEGMTGYAPEDFYADPGLIRRLIHPAWQDYFRKEWRALLENRAPPFYEYQIVDRAGNTRWMNQRNILVTDETGKAVAIEGIVTDITRQKTVEHELRRSELRALAVSGSAGEWIWEVDAEGIYRYSSPAVTKILGYLPEDLVGKLHYYDLFDPSVREDLRAQASAAIASREPFKNFINLNRHRNGTPVILSTSATPVFDDTGAFTGYCGVDEDITERTASQTALQAMVRSMVGTTGLDSLKKITQNISTWLQADCVMAGEIQPDCETVKVLSMVLDGKAIEGFSYTLRGTPCEDASEKGFCIYPDNVRQAFPGARDLADLEIRGYIGTPLRDSRNAVIGILCVLTRRPIQPSPAIREIMDILAVKAAAELERHRIEDELQKSRSMLAEAMDLANLVNWEYDVATDRFSFDDRFYALYGTSAQREGGNRMSSETYAREFLHPADRNMVAEEIQKALDTTDPSYVSYVEHRIIRRDGEIRYISVRIAVTKDSSGRTIRTHGANQDITERKKIEESLRESRSMLANAMDLANVVNWEFDPATGEFVFNDRFYALFGTTAKQEGGFRMMPERYNREFVHPDDRDAVETAFRDGPASAVPGQEFQMEHRIIRRDGEVRTIVVRVGAVADAAGHLVSIHGINQDITERKRAEEALKESEEKFRALVETSPDMIWEIDTTGRFRYISPTIRTVMGYDPDQVIGKPITELIQDESRPEVQDVLEHRVSTGTPLACFEVAARHRDGRGMIIEIRSATVVGPDGRLIGMRGVARDITERRKAEEALRQATKKLQLLSGITRHDIGNQLLSLNGFVAMLHKNVADPTLETYFGRIKSASGQISSMIAFTKEYEKIGVSEPVWQDLKAVVDEAARGSLPPQIELKNGIPAGTCVFADPLIVKVFFNLLDNSVRHGERVTEVRASSRLAGRDLVIVWEDNGVGVPVEEKERIFERGFGSHTGLGMFLVREILSLTGITITENGVPGEGARFEMVVPEGAHRNTAVQ